MHFSTGSILYGALAGLAAVSGVRADACSDGPFADSSSLVFGAKGYNPSTPFCHTRWQDGQVVIGIEVWSNKYHIAGVKLSYSDSTSDPVQGNTAYGSNKSGDDKSNENDYRHASISWAKEERITKMEAATNKDGKALGYLYIEVAGKKLEVGSDKYRNKEAINLGMGFLLGAMGETNAFPSAWTPLFLGNHDGTASVTDMKFDQSLDDVNAKQSGISAITLSEVYIKNTNPLGSEDSDQTWTFTGSTVKGTSTSTSNIDTSTFGVEQSISVEANFGVPVLAQATVSSNTAVSYQYETTTDKTVSSSGEQTLQWSSGASDDGDLVQPGHAKHCKATAWEGSYKGGFTSTVTITVNGKVFTYNQKGVFNSISYTTASTECRDVLLSEIPSSAPSVDAPSTTTAKRAVSFIA